MSLGLSTISHKMVMEVYADAHDLAKVRPKCARPECRSRVRNGRKEYCCSGCRSMHKGTGRFGPSAGLGKRTR